MKLMKQKKKLLCEHIAPTSLLYIYIIYTGYTTHVALSQSHAMSRVLTCALLRAPTCALLRAPRLHPPVAQKGGRCRRGLLRCE
jgi:hypothetical protein